MPLTTTESYIVKLHPHPISFFGFYFFGIFFVVLGFFLFQFMFTAAVCAIVIGALIFIAAEISRRATTFYVLDGGVEQGYQLLTSSREFVDYAKIQDLRVSEGIIQSMFSVGDIQFDTAGVEKIDLTFHSVKNPYGLEKIIRDKMSKSTSSTP